MPRLDQAIRQFNSAVQRPIRGRASHGLRPFPGGVKGDLALGSTGFVYCRYGAFQGALADKGLIYDPVAQDTCPDPRFKKPYPDFIRRVPTEISAVQRG